MPLDQAVNTFTAKPLQPSRNPEQAQRIPINIAPSSTLAKGTVLGQLAAAANDVQTFSITGTPTGGTFTLSGTNPYTGAAFTTAAIAYNAAASAVQTALVAVLGTGNVTCSGGALPGTVVVVTLAGSLVSLPMPVMTASLALTTGGSPVFSIAHTTTGATAGTYAAYSSAVVAAPTTAPVPTASGASGTFGAGTYAVQYTYVNAQGETTASLPAVVTLTSAQGISVAAITSIPAGVTAVNVYVAGVFAQALAVTANATSITVVNSYSATVSASIPKANTAYTVPGGAGTQTAKGVLMYDCASDAAGNITYGTSATGGYWGETSKATVIYSAGTFFTSDLTGLDAKALTDMSGAYIANTEVRIG